MTAHSWWKRLLAAAGLLLVLHPLPAFAQANTENSVKAAVVFNLMLFVSWPEAPAAESGLQLCLLEESGLLAAMRQFQGRKVNGVPLNVVRAQDAADGLRPCHAVMIETGNPSGLARAAAVARSQPLLVIGEGASANAQGAMIAINTDAGRVALDIDLGALRRARLNASSKLLKLARRVLE